MDTKKNYGIITTYSDKLLPEVAFPDCISGVYLIYLHLVGSELTFDDDCIEYFLFLMYFLS